MEHIYILSWGSGSARAHRWCVNVRPSLRVSSGLPHVFASTPGRFLRLKEKDGTWPMGCRHLTCHMCPPRWRIPIITVHTAKMTVWGDIRCARDIVVWHMTMLVPPPPHDVPCNWRCRTVLCDILRHVLSLWWCLITCLTLYHVSPCGPLPCYKQ